MTPESLGFASAGGHAWTKVVRGRAVCFRSLRTLAEMIPIEDLERAVMGVTDLDLFPASGLVGVPETGGHVLAAYIDTELVGAVYGFGGYVKGVPRLSSDWMGILPEFRSFGLGAELKKLQAAIAAMDGFREIGWTVDPLRAANARLNFERLGAWSGRYEENRYGESYGTALYGGLPTDRLNMTWEIADPAVEARLRGDIPPRSARDVADVEPYLPRQAANQALILVPADIDAIIASDLQSAIRWRMILREAIQHAFDDGFVIRGFVPGVGDGGALSAYVLERGKGNQPV